MNLMRPGISALQNAMRISTLRPRLQQSTFVQYRFYSTRRPSPFEVQFHIPNRNEYQYFQNQSMCFWTCIPQHHAYFWCVQWSRTPVLGEQKVQDICCSRSCALWCLLCVVSMLIGFCTLPKSQTHHGPQQLGTGTRFWSNTLHKCSTADRRGYGKKWICTTHAGV